MFDNILRNYLTIFILFFSLNIFGQTSSEIDPPTLSFENEKLYINYHLDNSSNFYHVQIEVINSSGNKINANALNGDIGSGINAGKNKSVIWDISQDNIFLDETISVKLIVELTPLKLNKGKLMLQSAILPGWGQTKLNRGKPYWIIGCAGVACLAGSYVYNHQSANSYDKYINAISAEDNKKHYDLAVQQDNTSKILGYSALGIWIANIIWVAVIPDNKFAEILPKNGSLSVLPVNIGRNNTAVSLSLSLNL